MPNPPPLLAVADAVVTATTPQGVLDCISRHQATFPVVWELAAAHAVALDEELVRIFARHSSDLLAHVARNPAAPLAVRMAVAYHAVASYATAPWARSAFEALVAPGRVPRDGALWLAITTLATADPKAALSLAQVPDLPERVWEDLMAHWMLSPSLLWVLSVHPVATGDAARSSVAAILSRWTPWNLKAEMDVAAFAAASAAAPSIWDRPQVAETVAGVLAAQLPSAPALTTVVETLALKWQATPRFLFLWRLLAAHRLPSAVRVLRRVSAPVRQQISPEDLMPLLTSDDAEIRLAAVAGSADAVGAQAPLAAPRTRHAVSLSGR